MSVHSPCPKSLAPEIEGPTEGGPQVFNAGDLQNELKVELETLKTLNEITIGSVLL